MDSFTASQSDKHPTDMAGMKGARLVTASETEEGPGLGRVKDQSADWWRCHLGSLHETGFFRVSARVQADDRRKS